MSKLTLAAFALVFGAALATPACSDSGKNQTVRWVDGWKKGVAAAKKKGKPMLVYVGRHSPT